MSNFIFWKGNQSILLTSGGRFGTLAAAITLFVLGALNIGFGICTKEARELISANSNSRSTPPKNARRADMTDLAEIITPTDGAAPITSAPVPVQPLQRSQGTRNTRRADMMDLAEITTSDIAPITSTPQAIQPFQTATGGLPTTEVSISIEGESPPPYTA